MSKISKDFEKDLKELEDKVKDYNQQVNKKIDEFNTVIGKLLQN